MPEYPCVLSYMQGMVILSFPNSTATCQSIADRKEAGTPDHTYTDYQDGRIPGLVAASAQGASGRRQRCHHPINPIGVRSTARHDRLTLGVSTVTADSTMPITAVYWRGQGMWWGDHGVWGILLRVPSIGSVLSSLS